MGPVAYSQLLASLDLQLSSILAQVENPPEREYEVVTGQIATLRQKLALFTDRGMPSREDVAGIIRELKDRLHELENLHLGPEGPASSVAA